MPMPELHTAPALSRLCGIFIHYFLDPTFCFEQIFFILFSTVKSPNQTFQAEHFTLLLLTRLSVHSHEPIEDMCAQKVLQVKHVCEITKGWDYWV